MKKLLEYGIVLLIGLFFPLAIVLIVRVLFTAYTPDVTPFIAYTAISGVMLPAIYLLSKAIQNDMCEN